MSSSYPYSYQIWARRLLMINAAHALFGLLGTLLYRQFGFAPPFDFQVMMSVGAIVNILLGSAIGWLLIASVGSAKSASILLIFTLLIGYGAEVSGVYFGIPFGEYRYTGKMGPEALGVPLIIPLAWFMMMFPSYVIARRLSPPNLIPLGVALVMLFWDVLMEPVMSHALGYWQWTSQGGYYNVPHYNWLGWALVAGFIGWIFHRILSANSTEPAIRNTQRESLALFALQATFTVLMGAIYHLWLPVLVWLIGFLLLWKLLSIEGKSL